MSISACTKCRSRRSSPTPTTAGRAYRPALAGPHPPSSGPPEHSSLLPLPHDYVVPGGRFTELYYWDSYFTMLGPDESGHCDLLRAMADNFAYLIDTYGHVPNGNRTYYLGRSQPPVFALMTELFEETGVHRASDYLPQLHKEYAFWMEGADVLRRARRIDAACVWPMEWCSTVTGTSAQRRARSPTARMWKPRAPAAGRGTRSIATCAPVPSRAGISARAGSTMPTGWRPSAPPASCRSTSTRCSTSWSGRSPSCLR